MNDMLENCSAKHARERDGNYMSKYEKEGWKLHEQFQVSSSSNLYNNINNFSLQVDIRREKTILVCNLCFWVFIAFQRCKF
jgi:hypothetical protein